MKALKIIGTGLVCSAIYSHFAQNPTNNTLVDRILKEG